MKIMFEALTAANVPLLLIMFAFIVVVVPLFVLFIMTAFLPRFIKLVTLPARRFAIL